MIITGTDGNDTAPFGLQGTNQADVIDGRAGNDWILGGGGNDILVGGLGNDLINGGADTDTVSYAYSKEAVYVSLEGSTGGTMSLSETDSLFGIENVWGTEKGDLIRGDDMVNELTGRGGVDLLYGGAGADRLSGGDGDDWLSGEAGSDWLSGGAGIDVATYASSSAGVSVDLHLGTGIGGDAANDTFDSIENVIGSGFADILTGNGVANRLEGEGGNDKLSGGAGKDFLAGGLGLDRLYGGGAADTFSFDSGDSAALKANADVIEDFSHAQHDKIDLSGVDGTLKFVGTEAFTDDNQVRTTVSGGDTFLAVNSEYGSTPEMWIKLEGVHDLHASDFVL